MTLGYFKEETLIPEPRPNTKDGTVDIVYKVEENQTSQLQLQGGYGNGMIIGQVGIQLNNFSARNIFNKKAWQPLPAGIQWTLLLCPQRWLHRTLARWQTSSGIFNIGLSQPYQQWFLAREG